MGGYWVDESLGIAVIAGPAEDDGEVAKAVVVTVEETTTSTTVEVTSTTAAGISDRTLFDLTWEVVEADSIVPLCAAAEEFSPELREQMIRSDFTDGFWGGGANWNEWSKEDLADASVAAFWETCGW